MSRLVRRGAAIISLGMLGALAACDGDDAVGGTDAAVDNFVPPVVDANTTPDTSSPQPDASDATADSSVPDTAAHLNIANDHIVLLDGFRFCAMANSGATQPGPADVLDTPAYPTKTFNKATLPGLAVGRGFRLPSLLPSYQGKRLRFIAYFVESLDLLGYGNLGCKDLVKKSFFDSTVDGGDAGTPANDQLIQGLDFEYVADFPAGTFVDGKSYALVITGCAKTTAPADQVRCYQFDGANPKSTMNMYARQLDNTSTAAAGKNRVQLIHGADRMLTFGEDHLNLYLTYDLNDPNKDVLVVDDLDTGVPYAKSGPALPNPAKEVQKISDLQALFTHLQQVDDEDSLQMAVDATDTPLSSIVDKKNYTFVVVGSPTAAPEINGQRNFLHIHNIIFPND
ncbi:MAG: hypothetical protein U0174_22345 [Polyangiaceae bacterium]